MADMPPRLRGLRSVAPRLVSLQGVSAGTASGAPPLRPRPGLDRRGSAASRGYDGKWQRARVGYLRHHPLCVCCLANGVTSAAEVVDHVFPHRGDMVVFWRSEDWQALCDPCHREIKATIEARWERGEIDSKGLRLDREMPEWFAT